MKMSDKESMAPTISLQEAARVLKMRDNRSVKRFCVKNNVKIFMEGGSNRAFILHVQLVYARHKLFIGYLREKYNDKWFEAFQAYMNMDLLNVVAIEETGKGNVTATIDRYKVEGRFEKKFSERLTKIIREQ